MIVIRVTDKPWRPHKKSSVFLLYDPEYTETRWGGALVGPFGQQTSHGVEQVVGDGLFRFRDMEGIELVEEQLSILREAA